MDRLLTHTQTHDPRPTHQVKGRMEACRATLQEAARWHQLVREANAGFAGGELGRVRFLGLAYWVDG